MPEGIITFSVMPFGKNLSLIKDLCSDFHDFISNGQKNELDSDIQDEICGYHFDTYIWLIIPISTEKVKHSNF